MRGPAYLVAGIFLFTLLDANSKLLSGTYGVGQVIAFRHLALLALFLLVRMAVPGAGGPLGSAHPGLHLLRAAAMVVAAGGFFLAFRQIPLAEGYLVFFTAPFLSLALAALVLRERVPPAAWLWSAVGFAGVLVALAPRLGTGGGPWFAYLSALCGTAAYATVLTINRKLRAERGIARLTLWPSVVGLAVYGPLAALDWTPPPARDAALLAVNGLLAGGATLLLAMAFRHAPVSRLAPFEFVGLPLSVAWDLVLWGVLPAPILLLGGAVVVLACVMSERAQRRAIALAATRSGRSAPAAEAPAPAQATATSPVPAPTPVAATTAAAATATATAPPVDQGMSSGKMCLPSGPSGSGRTDRTAESGSGP